MTLRLVLISLVAGLGLGPPAWPTVEGWVEGAQKWMNARLAAADARPGERRLVIHELLAAEMQRAHAARLARRTAAPALAPRPAIVAIAHEIAPRRPAALAQPLPFPLPKLDDYLTAAATPPAAPAVSAVRLDELAAMVWDRARPLAADLGAGLRRAAERDALALADLEGFDGVEIEGAAMIEPAPLPDQVFAAIEGPAPIAVEGPAPAAVEPEPASSFVAMERTADLYFAPSPLDEAEPALAEAAESAVAAEAIDLAELPADVFAPSPAETVVADAAIDAEPEAAPPRVGQAIRLTREALSAWINVLSGPALVTTASRGGPTTR